MTVFYTMFRDGSRDYTFTRYLGHLIIPDVDISYWIVPGTLED